MSDTTCVETVFAQFHVAYGAPRCKRTGKVQRDGKWYCLIHDPVAREHKRKEANRKWDNEWAARQKSQEESKRRAKAGEMGVELAKMIRNSAIVSDPYKYWHGLVAQAQAVLDALGEKG